MTQGFGARLAVSWERYGRLCAGIDPHEHLLAAWGLNDDAAGARAFALRVIDASAGVIGAIKPQVAFFERFGSAGFVVLEEVFAAARAAGLLVIADAKRGDVGSTMAGYASAWLSPGAPLEADALTVNPYQGVGSLAPALELAQSAGKGLFVLAVTSNPEGSRQQRARVPAEPGAPDAAERTLGAHVLADVHAWNSAHRDPQGAPGSVGVVVGATLDLGPFGLTSGDVPVPVLAPGFGHQGARLDGARERFGALADGVIVAESRSLLDGGPAALAERIRTRAEEVRESFA